MNLADERKIIYVIENTTDPKYKGWVKVGDTSEPSLEVNNHPNSNDLRKFAAKRVKQYMTTAGLSFKIDWVELADSHVSNRYFRDYDVHNVLERSGFKRQKVNGVKTEWFKASPKDAIKAIHAVKNNQSIISPGNNNVINTTNNLESTTENKSNHIKVIVSKPYVDHSITFKSQIIHDILSFIKDCKEHISNSNHSICLIFDTLKAIGHGGNVYDDEFNQWITLSNFINKCINYGVSSALIHKLLNYSSQHSDLRYNPVYPINIQKGSFKLLTYDTLTIITNNFIKKIKQRTCYDNYEKKIMNKELQMGIGDIYFN